MIKQGLISAYRNNIDVTLKVSLEEINDHSSEDELEDKKFGRWATTWWQQFLVLLRRGVKERKHESFSAFNIIELLLVALLFGLLWWQSSVSRLQDQDFEGFFSISSYFHLLRERMILEKERSSGMYRLSSYFMSRIIADLPMEVILPTVFLLITYLMSGLKHTVINFFCTLFVLLLNVFLVTQGLGLALAALVMDQKAATTLGPVLMLTFLLAGGFFVQHVPQFIARIKYFSISQYTYKFFMASQYKANEAYPCSKNGRVCSIGEFPTIKKVGLDGQATAIVALIIMVVGYRLGAYIAYIDLMRIGVPK